MAQSFSMTASKRDVTGKRVKKLRAQGLIPGVVYGSVVETPIPVTVDERDLVRTYQAIGGFTLMELHVEDDTHTVYIRNLQKNPVKRKPLHAEFFAPNLTVAMTAAVPVHLVGEAQNDALVVMQTRDTVELRGLPAALPGAIDVDISGLAEVDDSIYVADIGIPADVEIITDPSELIVRLTEPRVVVEEEVEAEVVEGDEAEAAAARAEGDAEPAGEEEESDEA